jgi:Ser/Thr protein kinase RdoA (MazF antagonist)
MISIPPEILKAFALEGASVAPLGHGLINETFAADLGDSRWVLQRVNPIFDPTIHESIQAVGQRLRSVGILSPRFKRDGEGQLHHRHGEHTWRALERVEGVSFDSANDVAQLEKAARFVARWHRALDSLDHDFRGQRQGVHDTPRHLEKLRRALREHSQHRLAGPVASLASALEEQLSSLPPLPKLAMRVAHGDLKLNNLLFDADAAQGAGNAVCLIDLDTLGPMLAAHELGDALRSWCNRAGENESEACLDLDFYQGATHAYLEAYPEAQRPEMGLAMWLGADWVSLELTARFLADALNESYFGFDAENYEGRGEHNLHRARGQWSMHLALARTRDERQAMLP